MKNITILLIIFLTLSACEQEESHEGEENPTLASVTFTFPTTNTDLYNNVITKLEVSTSENVKKVEYFIDGKLIGSTISKPFSYEWTPTNIDGGEHLLTAVAIPLEGEDLQTDLPVNFILRLGDSFNGGNIFYLDETNEHGLIAAEEDLALYSETNFFWGKMDEHLGATDTESGEENTLKMANSVTDDYFAGYPFHGKYEHNGYDDWYIPAKEELILLKDNQGYAGGFSKDSNSASYWSSTELTIDKAYALNFVALIGTDVSKGEYSYRVRPIRKF